VYVISSFSPDTPAISWLKQRESAAPAVAPIVSESSRHRA
jgi:hypothetical protein